MSRIGKVLTWTLLFTLVIVSYRYYDISQRVGLQREYINYELALINDEADMWIDRVRLGAEYLERPYVLNNLNEIARHEFELSDTNVQKMLKDELDLHFFNYNHVLPNSCAGDITSLYGRYESAVNLRDLIFTQYGSLRNTGMTSDKFKMRYSVADSTVHFGTFYYDQEFKFKLYVNDISYVMGDDSFVEVAYDSVLNIELFKYELVWGEGVIDTSSVRLQYFLY